MLPQFFVADLVGPADLQDLPQAGVDVLSIIVIYDIFFCPQGLSDMSRQLLASSSRDLATTGDTNNTSQPNLSSDTSNNAADSGAFSGNNTGKSTTDGEKERSQGERERSGSRRTDKQVAFSGGQNWAEGLLTAGLPPSGTFFSSLYFVFIQYKHEMRPPQIEDICQEITIWQGPSKVSGSFNRASVER
jgi:hypothetical protein